MKFLITIFQDEDGMYIAECPAIPGCVSQGQTEVEAERNINEAIKECLAVRAEKGLPLTVSTCQIGGMGPIPLLRPKEVVKVFERLGWEIARLPCDQAGISSPPIILRPFFEKVWEECGLERPKVDRFSF